MIAQPPLLCRLSQVQSQVFKKIDHRSKQEDRHKRFIRGDALAAEVSLLLRNPALLIEIEGRIPDVSVSNLAQ